MFANMRTPPEEASRAMEEERKLKAAQKATRSASVSSSAKTTAAAPVAKEASTTAASQKAIPGDTGGKPGPGMRPQTPTGSTTAAQPDGQAKGKTVPDEQQQPAASRLPVAKSASWTVGWDKILAAKTPQMNAGSTVTKKKGTPGGSLSRRGRVGTPKFPPRRNA